MGGSAGVVRVVAGLLVAAVWALGVIGPSPAGGTMPTLALTLIVIALCAAMRARLSIIPTDRPCTLTIPWRTAPVPARVHDPDRPGAARPRAPGQQRF